MMSVRGEREKTTVNFAELPLYRRIPFQEAVFAVAAAVFIAMFAKFAVVERLDELRTAQMELSDAGAELAALQTENAGYEQLDELHGALLAADSTTALDCRGIIRIVDEIFRSNVTVNGISASGGVLNIELTLPGIERVSEIIGIIGSSELAGEVALSTVGAAGNGSDGADGSGGADGSEYDASVRVKVAVTLADGGNGQ